MGRPMARQSWHVDAHIKRQRVHQSSHEAAIKAHRVFDGTLRRKLFIATGWNGAKRIIRDV